MNRIPIVYYHSVAPSKNVRWYKSALTLELAHFENFLKFLKSAGYVFLHLDEYFKCRQSKNYDGRAISIHFDDGYLDNYVYVYPLLKKYQAKATIFVNPEFVPSEEVLRPTLEDVWQGRLKMHELNDLGFINWAEMRMMESTGHVEIQSHTLTHAKYNFNDNLVDVHRPGANYLNTIGNRFPEMKPYYMGNKEFEMLLPYGTPLFEEKSSFLVRRVWINQEFEFECIERCKGKSWDIIEKENLIRHIEPIYLDYKKRDALIVRRENQSEFEERVKNELLSSRIIISEKLNKSVAYCCWPHGDYSDYSHLEAMQCGYKATTIVLGYNESNDSPDRFDRIGHGALRNNRFLTMLRMRYKLSLYKGLWYARTLNFLYLLTRNGK